MGFGRNRSEKEQKPSAAAFVGISGEEEPEEEARAQRKEKEMRSARFIDSVNKDRDVTFFASFQNHIKTDDDEQHRNIISRTRSTKYLITFLLLPASVQ